MLHNLLQNYKIILASASPRRKEILDLLGLSYHIKPAIVDESISMQDHLHPQKYVQKIASQKCLEVARQVEPNCIIIAADTIVYLQQQILGKPQNKIDAHQYLSLLSGKSHLVYTSLAIYLGNKQKYLRDPQATPNTKYFLAKNSNLEIIVGLEKTTVFFNQLTDIEIFEYLETDEPLDKAGAYGIQGYGSQFIKKINGCYFNVMGLPINLLYQIIKNCI